MMMGGRSSVWKSYVESVVVFCRLMVLERMRTNLMVEVVIAENV